MRVGEDFIRFGWRNCISVKGRVAKLQDDFFLYRQFFGVVKWGVECEDLLKFLYFQVCFIRLRDVRRIYLPAHPLKIFGL